MAFPVNRRPAYGMQPQGANLPPSAQNAAYLQSRMGYANSLRTFASFRVNPLVKFLFYVVTALLVTNQLSPSVRVARATALEEGYGRPLYPAVVAILFAMVFASTKERARGEYFLYSWTFWIIFTVCGFMGAYQITTTLPYAVCIIVLKIWLTAICIPWITFRVVSPERIVFFQKFIIHVILFGGLLCLLQMFLPGFAKPEALSFFLSPASGRAHGCWINSNYCGAILLTGLIFTGLVEWKSRSYLLAIRFVLTLAIFCTFSRMAITGTLLAFLIKGLFTGRPARLLVGATAALFCVVAFFVFATLVDDGTIKLGSVQVTERVQRIGSLLKGDVSEESDNADRILLWQEAIRLVVERGGTIIGTGHGSMATAAFGSDPHNSYITVWGNSGLMGLFAYLGWYVGCLFLAWRIPNKNIRAGLIAFFVIAMYRDITSQTFLGTEFGGPLMAVPALNFYYSMKQKNHLAFAPPRLAS